MNHFRFGASIFALAWLASVTLLADETPRPTVVLSSKIATDGDFVVLPVKVQDVWMIFMVDTGCRTTYLDAKFREQLAPAGDAQKPKAIPYSDDPRLYAPPEMTVGGTETGAIRFPFECAVACRDFSDMRAASKFSIQGVLGMDFLENYALELDLDEGQLKLLDASTLLKAARHDAVIAMDLSRRQPNVEIESHDTVMRALIDTGALLSLEIQKEGYEYLVKERQFRPRLFEIDIDGEKKVKATSEGRLRELKLGPFTHRSLNVDSHHCCLLGLYYWRRYKCVFDFPGKKVYLDKSSFFDWRDDTDHAGIYVESIADAEGGRRIAYVAQGTEADWLEIQPGDRLISIDGKAVELESVHGIYRRLSFRLRRSCELVIARDGSQIRVVIPATDVLPQP